MEVPTARAAVGLVAWATASGTLVAYDEDLGQASWLTAAEAREFFGLLQLGPGRTALEVACGSGGVTCRMAVETGASCVGIDINPHGIEAARRRATGQDLASRVTFHVADAGRPLPFPDGSFDAVFCNDSINHIPGRAAVLRDWHRVLRPGGYLLVNETPNKYLPFDVHTTSLPFINWLPSGLAKRIAVKLGRFDPRNDWEHSGWRGLRALRVGRNDHRRRELPDGHDRELRGWRDAVGHVAELRGASRRPGLGV